MFGNFFLQNYYIFDQNASVCRSPRIKNRFFKKNHEVLYSRNLSTNKENSEIYKNEVAEIIKEANLRANIFKDDDRIQIKVKEIKRRQNKLRDILKSNKKGTIYDFVQNSPNLILGNDLNENNFCNQTKLKLIKEKGWIFNSSSNKALYLQLLYSTKKIKSSKRTKLSIIDNIGLQIEASIIKFSELMSPYPYIDEILLGPGGLRISGKIRGCRSINKIDYKITFYNKGESFRGIYNGTMNVKSIKELIIDTPNPKNI